MGLDLYYFNEKKNISVILLGVHTEAPGYRVKTLICVLPELLEDRGQRNIIFSLWKLGRESCLAVLALAVPAAASIFNSRVI